MVVGASVVVAGATVVVTAVVAGATVVSAVEPLSPDPHAVVRTATATIVARHLTMIRPHSLAHSISDGDSSSFGEVAA